VINPPPHSVAILFAAADSIYFSMKNCDVYDVVRDARCYKGGLPVIAHPPCRAWGRLRAFAKPRPGEKDLARFAVSQVRAHGGVLEHPKVSLLWADQQLPEGTVVDQYGGFTLHVDQFWWGHKARKSTRLYICGCSPGQIPPLPFKMGEPEYVVAHYKNKYSPQKKVLETTREREATPPLLAQWLFDLALVCGKARAAA